MVRYKVYQVVKEFDSSQDFGVSVHPKEAQCLSILKKGQTLTQKQFLDQNKNQFKQFKIYQKLVYLSFGTGKKIGMLKDIPPPGRHNFCALTKVMANV